MRPLSALALTLPLLTAPVAAQNRPLLGVYGGVNFAELGGDDVGEVSSRTGLQAGAFASIPLGGILALVPGVAYSQEGTDVETGTSTSLTVKLDYLEVPLLLKVAAPLQGDSRLRPFAVAGPSLGFNVGCKLRAESGAQSAELDCDDPLLGLETKTVQAGLLFGAGLEFAQLFVGVRYQLGLTSIDDTGSDADIKNRVLSIVAGYGFRLGH